MDKEQIRKALDHFENDDYTDAKEILTQEIRTSKEAFLTDKLGIQEFGHDKKKDDDDDDDDDKKKKKKEVEEFAQFGLKKKKKKNEEGNYNFDKKKKKEGR